MGVRWRRRSYLDRRELTMAKLNIELALPDLGESRQLAAGPQRRLTGDHRLVTIRFQENVRVHVSPLRSA